MILPAKLYEDQLRLAFEAALREDFERYRWYRAGSATPWTMKLADDGDWGAIERVSLLDGEILGFFSASVYRDLNVVDGIAALSFVRGRKSIAYLRDLSFFLDSLCSAYSYVRYQVSIGNPAAASWERAALRRGGRVVGEIHRSGRSATGEFLDSRMFEIPGAARQC